jgi:hypothetical protein
MIARGMNQNNKQQVVIQDNRVTAARYDMSAQEKEKFFEETLTDTPLGAEKPKT